MGQSHSTPRSAPPAFKKVQIEAANAEQAIGMAIFWLLQALAGEHPPEGFISLRNMSHADVSTLLKWFSEEQWKNNVNVQIDKETMKKLGIKVTPVPDWERRKSWAAKGAAAGAVVATLVLACGAVPVFGWLLGGGILIGGVIAGAVSGVVAGTIADHVRPGQIKVTLTQEGIRFAEQKEAPVA